MTTSFKLIKNEFVFSEEQVNLMYEMYLKTGNTQSCQQHFNVSKFIILKQLKKFNKKLIEIKDRKFYNGVTIDRGCFSDFSREKDCYFYGLLLADGSLSSKTNQIQIALCSEDLHIIENLKDWLNSSNKISHRESQRHKNGKITKTCCLYFGDKIIAQNLKLQGFEPNKTTKEKLPKFLKSNPENQKHFWRGFVDGDGHLAQRHSSILELCGSEEILNGFVEYCKSLGVSEKTLRRDSKSKNFFRVSYSGEDARKITRELYSNSSVYLERKYKTYLKFEDFQKHIDSKRKPDDMKYIMSRSNKYIVQVNGKYLSCVSDLNEAKSIRDSYLIINKNKEI